MGTNKVEKVVTTVTTLTTKKESAIQSECFIWHWNSHPKERMQLFMVYNTPKNAAHGAILRAMGMVKGVSDLIYASARGIVFLECKRPGEGQSEVQIEFEHKVKALGYEYHVFRSLEEFKNIIASYQD